jgi:hypothetical protein
VKVVIPRPDQSGLPVGGVGKVWLVSCYDLLSVELCEIFVTNELFLVSGVLGICRYRGRCES